MKIKMRVLASGPNGHKLPGKEYLVADEEGAALFEGGFADIVPTETAESEDSADGESDAVETAATAGAPETAEGQGNRRGQRKGGRK